MSMSRQWMRWKALAALLIFVLGTALMYASPAKAATFTVSNTNDSGAGSLRQAIVDANASAGEDTITFAPGVEGTITLTSGELHVTDALIVEGPGADTLAVSGNDSSRVFYGSADLSMSGLTISGGNAGSSLGGGVYSAVFGTLTLIEVIVEDNVAEYGGGVNSDGALLMRDSVIRNNVSNRIGGGIYAGAYGTGGTVALAEIAAGSIQIIDSTVSGNQAFRDGGGIALVTSAGATATVSGATVSGNSAPEGGGVYSDSNRDQPATRVVNSTISGNSASVLGGGFYNYDGPLEIENTTVTANSAPEGSGGGTGSFGDEWTLTTVKNSIIAANSVTDVDLVYEEINSFRSGGYNIIGSGGAAGAFNAEGDRTGVEDPGLEPLADNGGPTRTHALKPGSPAVDAIAEGNCDVRTDQRGVSRPQAAGADGQPLCDIGAFEIEAPAPPPPPDPDPDPTPNPQPTPKPQPKPNPNACTIVGTPGKDVLRGTPGRDVICGLGGDDVLSGMGGNDILRGGPGRDVLSGGAGNDLIYGGAGNDRMNGDAGNDRLLGEAGNDTMHGGAGNDVLFGGLGNDVMKGGPGRDTLNGGPGRNLLQQ